MNKTFEDNKKEIEKLFGRKLNEFESKLSNNFYVRGEKDKMMELLE